MSVEESWFSGFRGVPDPGFSNPVYFGKPEKIREKWDIVEAEIRDVLERLTDEDLERPFDKKTHVF